MHRLPSLELRPTKLGQPEFDRPSPAQPAKQYESGLVVAGKYRLEELIGEGGMGAVWRATNLSLDCAVALKVIKVGLDREEMRLRLKLEAQSAAKLAHAGIVRIFDVGEFASSDPFIVMELLTGETLSEASFDAPLSASRAVQLLLPIAEALAFAHASGVVHRDLKPDNVFIAREDGRVQPKLLDFGIAKVVNASKAGRSLTQSGTLLGTPDYMSPEAARGRDDVDARSDVWSFCVMLYEQIAGRMPFAGENPYAILRSIIDDAPVPLCGDAPGMTELWTILRRGLDKDPAARFQSMTELGRSLALWLHAQGVQDDACGTSLQAKWLRSGVLSSSPRISVQPMSAKRRLPRRLDLWLSLAALGALVLCSAWSTGGRAAAAEPGPVAARSSLAATVAGSGASSSTNANANTSTDAMAPPVITVPRARPISRQREAYRSRLADRTPKPQPPTQHASSLDLIAPY